MVFRLLISNLPRQPSKHHEMKVHYGFILASIANPNCEVRAFIQVSTRSSPRSSPRINANDRCGCRQRHRTPIVRASSEEDEGDYDEILWELQNAKKEIYGADIPADEELKQAAINAEDAFLAEMLKQTQQFKQIKSEQGSDKAVEEFMKRMQDEQNPGDEAEAAQIDEGSTDDSVEKKWFAQRMHEEQNPGMISDDDSSWQ